MTWLSTWLLQEISQSEKGELQKRVRELERESEHAFNYATQVKELSEWKSKTEEQLKELHEMVDVGQAYEAMVETLTAKNLEVGGLFI